jgi:hypothetical protein
MTKFSGEAGLAPVLGADERVGAYLNRPIEQYLTNCRKSENALSSYGNTKWLSKKLRSCRMNQPTKGPAAERAIMCLAERRQEPC